MVDLAIARPVERTRLSRVRLFARRHKINTGLLFVLPAVGLFLFYVAWPIVSMLQYSFFDWDGLSPSKTFVGLQNYVALLTTDVAFRSSVLHNLQWAIIVPTVLIGGGFVLAFALSRPLRFRAIYRTAFFVPTVASLAVITTVWTLIYNPAVGPLNGALQAVGLGSLTQVWLADPNVTFYAVMTVALWAELGFFLIVQIAAIQAIPQELFESAKIDGANSFQQMVHIAAPLTRRTMQALLLLGLIGAVNEFGFVFLLSRGGPYHASEVMANQIYELAFVTNHTGYASALSVLLLVISMAITIPQLIVIRRRRRSELGET